MFNKQLSLKYFLMMPNMDICMMTLIYLIIVKSLRFLKNTVNFDKVHVIRKLN